MKKRWENLDFAFDTIYSAVNWEITELVTALVWSQLSPVHVELGQEVLSREHKRHQEPQALHGLLLSPKKVGSARLFEEGVGLSHKHLPNRHGINKTEHNSRDFIIRLCLKVRIFPCNNYVLYLKIFFWLDFCLSNKDFR